MLKLSFLYQNDNFSKWRLLSEILFPIICFFFQILYFFGQNGNFSIEYEILWQVKNVYFLWKFNFKGSKEIIFRMGHVTIGLHMLHSVNFWLDLKIESKNIRIFQIVDSTSKTDKNIEISFFKNIKKWTCEADFQGWKKVIFITQIWGHFKVQF